MHAARVPHDGKEVARIGQWRLWWSRHEVNGVKQCETECVCHCYCRLTAKQVKKGINCGMELRTPKRESRTSTDMSDRSPSMCDTLYPWNWSEECNVNLSPGSSCSSPEYRDQNVVGSGNGSTSRSAGIENHRRGRPRADALTNLMMQGSTSPSNIKCTYCNRVFPREKSLQAHLRTHTGKTLLLCLSVMFVLSEMLRFLLVKPSTSKIRVTLFNDYEKRADPRDGYACLVFPARSRVPPIAIMPRFKYLNGSQRVTHPFDSSANNQNMPVIIS